MKLSMLKRFSCAAIAGLMALAMVACSGGDEPTDATTTAGGDPAETTVATDPTEPGETEPGETTASQGPTASTKKISTTAWKKTSKQSQTKGTTQTTAKGGATNLTRDQVIAKMPADLKGSTVTYMYWWDPHDQMEGEAIEGFEKATGCKLNAVVASYSDFQTQVNAKIEAGEAPDLIRLLGNVTWQLNALQPVTNSDFDFTDKAWDQQLMKDYTFNGYTYATNLVNSAISDVAVIYYNTTALKAASMKDPYDIWKANPKNWTWEKFWAMCKEFTDANKGKAGYAGATFEYSDAYVRSLGGCCYYYDSAKGKFVNNMKNTATEQGYKTTLEMREKGYLLAQHDETKFDQGKVLFFWSGPYSARKKDNRQKALKDRNRLGVVPLPTDSKYQVMYEYTAFGIPMGAKNAKGAPYYLRWVLDRSSYNWSGVYYNAKAQEVLDYACSKTNRFYGYSAGSGDVFSALVAAGSAQVKSVLNSYYDSVEQWVTDENDRATYLGV